VQRLPGYISSMRTGWSNGRAEPVVSDVAPSMLRVDGGNGFAQVALAKVRDALVEKVRSQGMASANFHHIHHFAALWPDIEPFARQGFVALTVVNGRSHMVAWGGNARIFGTNPIAFACPLGEGDPLVFDLASSVMSQGDVLLARAAGRSLPEGVGVDAKGLPTTDPDAVIQGGALLPFAGAKGSSIAFMVEILGGVLSGSILGFEERSLTTPGAVTSKSGQFVLLIDPKRSVGDSFSARMLELMAAIRASGVERLPSLHRYERRRIAERDGIVLAPDQLRHLEAAEGVVAKDG
jgi:delta1-piperideine-2-carboxylate reductase